MENIYQDHVKSVSSWMLNSMLKQERYLNLDYLWTSYPYNFKKMLTKEGFQIVFESTVDAMKEKGLLSL